MREAEQQLERIGMAELDARARRQPRARPAAPDGDRPRALRRPDAAAARRARRGPAPEGEAGPGRRAAPAARRGPVDPAGRARHGPRDGPGRPRRRDGVRHQADRGHARRGAGQPGGARRLPRDRALNPTASPDRATAPVPAASPLLEVIDLHAGYGRAEVLHGLDLRAEAGQVITVIGPNGAGKSTLLNALMGVLPARGRIAYDGRDVGLHDARGARDAGHGAGARDARAVRHHAGRGQPAARRLPAGAPRPPRQKTPALRRGVRAVSAPEGAPRASSPARLSGGERQMLAVGARADGQARAADARRAEPRPRAAGRARHLRAPSPACARPA